MIIGRKFTMDEAPFTPNTMSQTLRDTPMDLDFMDELLYEGCWLEITDGCNVLQSSPSPSQYLPTSEANTDHFNLNSHQESYEEETERSNLPENPPLAYPPVEELVETQSQDKAIESSTYSDQNRNFLVEDGELVSKRWWVGPRANPGPSSSVKYRLMLAIGYLRETTKDKDVLIQIWVPVKREGKQVLTTINQPFSLDPNSQDLTNFRHVSENCHFPAEEDSKELGGLPSRVFLRKVPEWTPDVRFFRSEEYLRFDYARQYNVQGSLAFPVFEVGSGTCLGVVEIVATTQNINYRPELENVRKALEAVHLRSSEIFSPPKVKVSSELYGAELPEILEVLTFVCKTHGLPLAQMWAPCIEHGKSGCWNSEESNFSCVSMVESVYYVGDQQMLGFHEACSEYHLIGGQGIVGRAFETNQPCFAADVTAYSKTEYPLSHHARMFGLHAAVAIHLRSIYIGSTDFVLEFFLPTHCQDIEEPTRMLNSLSIVLGQACQNLRVLTDKELEKEVISDGRLDKKETLKSEYSSSKDFPQKDSYGISNMTEAQQKGKGVYVSAHDEFQVTNHWDSNEVESHQGQAFQDFGELQIDYKSKSMVESGGDSSSFCVRQSIRGRKPGEKRRTKIEKAISLQVLRQYFSGSLKDAATSIGVCPTTLKRICRQHGITRWPSRKIKKVGHSLQKLQLVIDSVQGSVGAIQVDNFYSNFPELSSPNLSGISPFSLSKNTDQTKQLNPQHEGGLSSLGATNSKSPSSSCSQSSSSSFCCSAEVKQHTSTVNATTENRDALLVEDSGGVQERACSDTELHVSNQEEPKLRSYKSFSEHPVLETLPPLTKSSGQVSRNEGAFKVKTSFGEENVRFSLQQKWGFEDVRQEIAKRFSIDNISRMDLKYLDDDSEWVLLTCDADLEECIDIYRSSQNRTIKLSLHQSSNPNLGSSFGSSGPS